MSTPHRQIVTRADEGAAPSRVTDPTSVIFKSLHMFLKARFPFAHTPFTDMVVTAIPPTTPAGTVQCRYPNQARASGMNYPYLASYTPVVGDVVVVVNRPRARKFVLHKFA